MYMNVFFIDNEGNEFNLYSTTVYEDCDSFEIVTQIRQPELKRGCVGDLIIVHKNPLDEKYIEDRHKDMLLRRIEVWSNDEDATAEWQYIFLKN